MSVIHETEQERAEQNEAIEGYLDALGRDDHEAARNFFRKIKLEACSLMAGKKIFGADYIREQGFNTEYADAKYGPGWLDRED